MKLLMVENLCKKYEKFTLENVSFSLEQGYIMGFIGRNGAGKTTTLKTMLNLVHPDAGTVNLFGKDFREEEFACKQEIGFVLGGADYYVKKKLGVIANVTKRFYARWDDAAFAGYLKRFELDLDKRIDELSAGMKVKFSLALALSHHARLLILDEPTSGLDPVSRDDLLEIFQSLIEEGDRSILFSTHITSDLEKCADYITYIKDGKILATGDMPGFLDSYRVVQGTQSQKDSARDQKLIGLKQNAFGFTALVRTQDLAPCEGLQIAPADLETIMIHCERE